MSSNFARLPSVSMTRSKFLRKSQHKTSLKLGEITPIYLDEVLPGDTRSLDIGSLIRMSTPIAPVMDNVYLDIYAFFVPNRIVWEHWKEFMGENNSSAGIYSGTEYKIPTIDISGISVGSVGDHYGLPINKMGTSEKVSVLPKRGYQRIYNRFFRDQNLIAPVTVSVGDTSGIGDVYTSSLYKAAKMSDYFTRSLPYAQKGSPVTIPLGTTAPVITNARNSGYNPATSINVYNDSINDNSRLNVQLVNSTTSRVDAQIIEGSSNYVTQTGTKALGGQLMVDLSSATSATINQLRFAFQYQKLLECES